MWEKRHRMLISVALHICVQSPATSPPPKTGEKERPKATLRHHVDEMHRNDEERPRFKMEVLKVFGGDALLRQVSEAVQIREESGQMNRQQEWRMVPRLGLLE